MADIIQHAIAMRLRRSQKRDVVKDRQREMLRDNLAVGSHEEWDMSSGTLKKSHKFDVPEPQQPVIREKHGSKRSPLNTLPAGARKNKGIWNALRKPGEKI